MGDLPSDVLRDICSFLTNDGVSIGRLSLCSKSLYDRLVFESPGLWMKLLEERWSVTLKDRDDPCTTGSPNLPRPDRYRQEYIRRHKIDRRAAQILDIMCRDLCTTLGLPGPEDENTSSGNDEGVQLLDGNEHVSQAWDHPLWAELSALGESVRVALRRAARSGRSAGTTRARLRGFLAARTLQNIEFTVCLLKWTVVHQIQEVNTEKMVTHPKFNAGLMEEYALVVNDIQQTPEQLILQDGDISLSVQKRLDRLAADCAGRMDEDLSIVERIQFVNAYMVGVEGFAGNSEDYYNYRNSLLDCVLDTKKGIPITLAILYTCVCRRLDLDVHLVGLPGHVVLGFRTEKNELLYLDVFHEGRLLDVEDCRDICDSYGVDWQAEFLKPLSAPHVLHRMLNNLARCHFHGLTNRVEPFHSDLFFNQRALASIHRQPRDAVGIVDRVAQWLPLALSPDLLTYYGLLSPARMTSEARHSMFD